MYTRIINIVTLPSMCALNAGSNYLVIYANTSFLSQFYSSLVLMVGLSVASVALPPPAGLPDLFPVLVSTFSFLHFLGTFIYFNIVQLSTPQGKQKTL